MKHVPQRTCVGCRTVLGKRQLVRLVRTEDGVRLDPTGKLAGRGAYVHERRACWEAALSGSLARALKVELAPADRERLQAHAQTLTDAEPGE
ncbi:MAG TPA: YlxR family protein [Anaerolineales bacterium]|nr:YlxR family protein [Anaerolineales bacterium]